MTTMPASVSAAKNAGGSQLDDVRSARHKQIELAVFIGRLAVSCRKHPI